MSFSRVTNPVKYMDRNFYRCRNGKLEGIKLRHVGKSEQQCIPMEILHGVRSDKFGLYFKPVSESNLVTIKGNLLQCIYADRIYIEGNPMWNMIEPYDTLIANNYDYVPNPEKYVGRFFYRKGNNSEETMLLDSVDVANNTYTYFLDSNIRVTSEGYMTYYYVADKVVILDKSCMWVMKGLNEGENE